MESKDAIDWLGLLKHENIEFDDYSEDTKELRERAIGCFQEALDLGIQALENQKIGHWVDDEFGSKCSYCDVHTHLDKFDRPMKFKYCSMCGAKMEGE